MVIALKFILIGIALPDLPDSTGGYESAKAKGGESGQDEE
jgi:hypothetical protein